MIRYLVPLLVLVLAGGCAPWSRAILGPGQGSALGMWSERGFETVSYRRGSGIQGLMPRLAHDDFHVEGTWSLVEYRVADAGGEEVSGVLVSDLREMRALDDALDRVMAVEDLFLEAHDAEARETLGEVPVQADLLIDGLPGPGGVQRRHDVTSVTWRQGELVVVVVSSIVTTAWAVPCSGTPMPQAEMITGGVRWTRTHYLDERGESLRVETGEREPVPPPAACDPRVARVEGRIRARRRGA